MPRASYSTSFLQGASGGLGRLASAVAGSGRTEQDAYEREMLAQSRLGQAVAGMQAQQAAAELNAAKAVEQQRANELQAPQAIRDRALLATGIPLDSGDYADEYMRTGRVGLWKPGTPAGPKGAPSAPTGFTPENLTALAQRVAASQAVLAGDAKGADDYFKGQNQQFETGLARAVAAGLMPPDHQARSMALLKATPLFKIPEGFSGNQFSGEIDMGAPVNVGRQGLVSAQTGAQKASAANSYASAAQHNAQTDKIRAATAVGPDGIPMVAAKPMPAAAVKLQQEALDAIGSASGINADLGALDAQIVDGRLNLGMTANAWNSARNYVGASTEQSRNLASFKATIEKLRNDSLRLNKGVQTEGDAVRAWNELLANVNDPQLVRQRLGEIQRINQRAAELQRLNIDTLRANFGHHPLDVSNRINVQPAVGATRASSTGATDLPAPAAGGGRTVLRTGRDPSGRRVIQYSDGSVAYAD